VFKKIFANFLNHEILVTNSWFTGAKLYIDGVCCSKNHQLFALNKSKVRLTGNLNIDGQDHAVEIFAWAPFVTVHLKICVDGNQIAGGSF